MSDLYNRIHDLCEQKGISIGRMCNELSISRGNLTELKMGRIRTLKADNLTKISGYFGITIDCLLGNEQKETALPSLTERDERDIEKRLQAMLGDLEGPDAGSLMFSGEPMDDETRELLKISLKNQLELSKRLAKQKYTPKKYRKEGE